MAGVLAFVLVLYVLSSGPCIRIYEPLSSASRLRTYRTLYAPLHWLCRKSPTLNSAMNWYVLLWYAPDP